MTKHILIGGILGFILGSGAGSAMLSAGAPEWITYACTALLSGLITGLYIEEAKQHEAER